MSYIRSDAYTHTDLPLRNIRSKIPAIALAIFCGYASLHAATVSVKSFGAVADAVFRADGVMVAGSNIFTSPSGSFKTEDVGRYIQVIGAGPGGLVGAGGAMNYGSVVLSSSSSAFSPKDVGRNIVVIGAGAGSANLVGKIQGYNSATSVSLSVPAGVIVSNASFFYGASTLEGMIQSVQSSAAITISVPAQASVAQAKYVYGTDNHAAFQSALDSVGHAGGGTVSIPAASGCPAGATCGYIVRASDQATAKAPGAVKIRYNNVSLTGESALQSNLFCRGAWSNYVNTPAYPGQTATMRGNCLAIGDNGGPNGQAGTSASNVTISKLHLYGMTNGNTFNNDFSFPPVPGNIDGWDVSHKAIYMWDGGTFANILIDAVSIQDFKGENIYSGGSIVTGAVIQNSTITNFNSDGISMLAASLKVLNNKISNGSNAGIENATRGATQSALVAQIYQGNTISLMPREAIVIYGVDGTVPSGSVEITGNYFDTIGQLNGNDARTAILLVAQNASGESSVAPANVTIRGNVCHDCYSFGLLASSRNTKVIGNLFVVDKYSCYAFMTFMYPMDTFDIALNAGTQTPAAVASSHSLSSVYVLDPGYVTGNFAWNNVTVHDNAWNFPGVPNYTFTPDQGGGWSLVTRKNIIWGKDICSGCTYPDTNHGVVSLATSHTIEPYGPVVTVAGNTAPVTATVDASKEQDGSLIRIANAGSFAVSFVSDSNMRLTAPVVIAPGGAATFRYDGTAGKFVAYSSNR